MPELPEVETMRRGIAGIAGRRIRNVRVLDCPRKPIGFSPAPEDFCRRVRGARIDAVDRLGKRVVVRLDGGESIVIEPRMTGLVLLADPPTREHLRLRIDFADPAQAPLYYWDRRGLGSVRLLSPQHLVSILGPDKLGPDALTLPAEMLRERLERSRRQVKVALLDQRAIAGIGNLYASEILYVARIHPERRCNELSPRKWRQLHAAMQRVLTEAIAQEGSTLSDGTYRNALNRAGGYQHQHRVYAREDQRCRQCKGRIRRIVQAQRATFFCPRCQPKKRQSNRG